VRFTRLVCARCAVRRLRMTGLWSFAASILLVAGFLPAAHARPNVVAIDRLRHETR
jgi:hypothetical protein